jgi:uncharacterized protein with HEPN domain
VRDDRIHLRHMLECIAAIREYTASGFDAFVSDRKTNKAVLRELHELAESARRLSPALKTHHPEIPWPAIAGFRNVIVHDYLGLNAQRVWSIVQEDLAPLEAAVRTMLAGLDASS